MAVLRIELIDPRARILLEDLAKLNLIKIQEEETPEQRFSELLAKLRSRGEDAPDLDDITKEVEMVRAERNKGNE